MSPLHLVGTQYGNFILIVPDHLFQMFYILGSHHKLTHVRSYFYENFLIRGSEKDDGYSFL